MRLPNEISPSPIIEAVAEMRFETELQSAVLFGKLYAVLSEDFTDIEQLPALELSPEILEKQPELRYVPHYRLKNDRFIVSIGQRVISVNRICIKEPYKDWNEYFQVIKKILTQIQKAELISEFEQVSLRYINLFHDKTSEVLGLSVELFDKNIEDYETLTTNIAILMDNDRKLRVNIGSDTTIEVPGYEDKGLSITLECLEEKTTVIADAPQLIDDLHEVVKQKFFESLKKEYLENLKPTYE